MLVYRFECSRGFGPWSDDPYSVRSYAEAVEEAYDAGEPVIPAHPSTMPGPNCEPKESHVYQRHHQRGWSKDHLFAFASIDQMLLTFPEPIGRKAMFEDGSKLKVFEVPDDRVVLGTRQVVFERSHATYLHTLHPETLEPMKEAA